MTPFEKYNNLKNELSELETEIENALECWVDAHASEINPKESDTVSLDGWTEFPDGIMVEVFSGEDANDYEAVMVPVEELLEYFKK